MLHAASWIFYNYLFSFSLSIQITPFSSIMTTQSSRLFFLLLTLASVAFLCHSLAIHRDDTLNGDMGQNDLPRERTIRRAEVNQKNVSCTRHKTQVNVSLPGCEPELVNIRRCSGSCISQNLINLDHYPAIKTIEYQCCTGIEYEIKVRKVNFTCEGSKEKVEHRLFLATVTKCGCQDESEL